MVTVCKCLSGEKKTTSLPKSRAAQPAEKDAVSDSWKLKVENFKIEIRDMFLKREIQTLGAAAVGTRLSFTPHARGHLSILTAEAPNQPSPVLLGRFPPSLSLFRPLLSPLPQILISHLPCGAWWV